jgi:uncharacterized RDD family membrane protein YckC
MLNYIFPAVATILFWNYCSATPGKMALNMKIVDAKTGKKPTVGQFIGRYLGYFPSFLVVMLGVIWVGIDSRKQGWHDKMAGTVVIKDTKKKPVIFEDEVNVGNKVSADEKKISF